MKFVIPTSRKFTCELIATDPCLRRSKYWGSWSCHSKSKQKISIKYSSIPSLEFLKHVCKKSLKSVLWFVINITHAEKKSVDGFLKRFICILGKFKMCIKRLLFDKSTKLYKIICLNYIEINFTKIFNLRTLKFFKKLNFRW